MADAASVGLCQQPTHRIHGDDGENQAISAVRIDAWLRPLSIGADLSMRTLSNRRIVRRHGITIYYSGMLVDNVSSVGLPSGRPCSGALHLGTLAWRAGRHDLAVEAGSRLD